MSKRYYSGNRRQSKIRAGKIPEMRPSALADTITIDELLIIGGYYEN